MKIINKIGRIAVYSFAFLLPLFFLPTFTSQFDLPKLILASITFTILFVCFGIKIVNNEKIELKYSLIDLFLLLFVLTYLLITLFITPNKMEATFVPGSLSVISLSFMIYFLGKQFIDTKDNYLGFCLFASSVLVSLVSVLIYAGISSQIPQLKSVITRDTFSTVGTKLFEVLFIVATLPIGIKYLIKEKDKLAKVFFVVAQLFIIIALTVNILSIKTNVNNSLSVSNFTTSWKVMVETFKNSPLYGIGPSNYQSAFNLYLPLSYNNQPNWNLRFSSASSYFMNVGTETGIIGLILYIVILVLLIKERKVSTLILAVSSLFLPFNSAIIFLLFILLLFEGNGKGKSFNLQKMNRYLILSKVVFVLALIGYTSFFGIKYVAAETDYKKAVDALTLGDGKKSYDLLKKVIEKSPKVDRYHITYSQVNFAIATSLSKKTDLTEEDKSIIATLIAQATREAKTAVTLNPQRSTHWENLAKIYQSIAPFTENASNFSLQAYNQAVALDPTNPNLRIALGGLYYALGNFDEAIKSFEIAVIAKPDLANAHYNLSAAYREKGDIEKAIKEMETVVTLSKDKDNDLKVAESELNNLKSRKVNTDFKETDNLTSPDN